MKAMIFAAGLGTRLKPLTDHMPKALVPIAGKPLLQRQLERLGEAGFDDVVVNVHHFADQIERWCAEHDVRGVRFSDERAALLETGGGIRHAAPLLRDADRFLIHNVDILSNVDLPTFWQQGEGKDAVLLVSERQSSRYLLFDDAMRLVGWTNVRTGEVKSPYKSLDINACRRMAFAGIHQMSTALLPLMERWEPRFSIIDFYLSVCAERRICGYVQTDLRLMDVGKIETLAEAEAYV
ncbi:MAG: nucleotidyltransferase family protein [Bacteroidaceae bacterium]|nr:nucleotidyltransferase family protein [Bacteroidaceae bacterium]